jgi:hypothetical protein
VIAGSLGVAQNTVSDWLNNKKRNNIGTDNVSIDVRLKIDPKDSTGKEERFVKCFPKRSTVPEIFPEALKTPATGGGG